MLPSRAEGADYDGDSSATSGGAAATVIAEPSSLIGDLLNMDIGGEAAVPRGLGGAPAPDLLGGGLDQLLAGGPPDPSLPGAAANNLLGDIFGLGSTATSSGHVPPKQVWLSPVKGKGLEISGTWSLKNNVINMEMTFNNKAMQVNFTTISSTENIFFFKAMQNFALQLNKNSFGLVATQVKRIALLLSLTNPITAAS